MDFIIIEKENDIEWILILFNSLSFINCSRVNLMKQLQMQLGLYQIPLRTNVNQATFTC